MTPLRRKIRDHLVQFAEHQVKMESLDASVSQLAQIEHEIDTLLAAARVNGAMPLADSASDKGLIRKIFPAGLPGLEDYRDLPDTPHVLLERAQQQAGIVGQSRVLRDALNSALMLAETNARVLIRGETGTGKDLLARLIHQNSPRRDRPFIVVNCGALTPQLVMSELFGHEPHSFTGADPRGRQGKVEAADGGTLFLDEVADLPSVGQSALLRFLDRGEIQKVGKSTTRHVNVRVISATHRNLEQMVSEGTFREDLYYRLFVADLIVPPLRERGDDVLRLAAHVLDVLRIEYGRSTPRALHDDAAKLLVASAWPGNVRQLRHVLEHAFIRTSAEFLKAEHFPNLAAQTNAPQEPDALVSSTLSQVFAGHFNGHERELERFLARQGQTWFTTPELAASLGVSATTARTTLRHLAEQGIMESDGVQRGRRYRVSPAFALDFPSKNSDINSLGELGED